MSTQASPWHAASTRIAFEHSQGRRKVMMEHILSSFASKDILRYPSYASTFTATACELMYPTRKECTPRRTCLQEVYERPRLDQLLESVGYLVVANTLLGITVVDPFQLEGNERLTLCSANTKISQP